MPCPLHSHGSMPCKQQSDILTDYQTHVFAKLQKQIKDRLRWKNWLKHWKAKDWTAMPALSKLLVLLAIFLLTSHVNSCMILSSASGGKQVWVDHLIEFEEPMNKPTCKSTCKPTNDLSIDLWQCWMEMDKINSIKKSQPCGQCQDKISEWVTFSKQEKDAELPYQLLPKHTQQAMIINSFSLNGHISPQFPINPMYAKKHVESILGIRKNMTKKVFNLNNTIPHSVRLVDPF